MNNLSLLSRIISLSFIRLFFGNRKTPNWDVIVNKAVETSSLEHELGTHNPIDGPICPMDQFSQQGKMKLLQKILILSTQAQN